MPRAFSSFFSCACFLRSDVKHCNQSRRHPGSWNREEQVVSRDLAGAASGCLEGSKAPLLQPRKKRPVRSRQGKSGAFQRWHRRAAAATEVRYGGASSGFELPSYPIQRSGGWLASLGGVKTGKTPTCSHLWCVCSDAGAGHSHSPFFLRPAAHRTCMPADPHRNSHFWGGLET